MLSQSGNSLLRPVLISGLLAAQPTPHQRPAPSSGSMPAPSVPKSFQLGQLLSASACAYATQLRSAGAVHRPSRTGGKAHVCGGSFREPFGLRVRRRPRGMNAANSAPLPTRLLTDSASCFISECTWSGRSRPTNQHACGDWLRQSGADAPHQAAFSQFNREGDQRGRAALRRVARPKAIC
jgi:hypothetical protein